MTDFAKADPTLNKPPNELRELIAAAQTQRSDLTRTAQTLFISSRTQFFSAGTLNDKLTEISEKLRVLTEQRLQLKAAAPDLVDTGDKTSNLSVVSETIKLLTAEYSIARKATEESHTKAAALQRAIAKGEDILQFAMEALDSAGRQLIEQSMGLGSTDALHVQRINQELLDLRSELRDGNLKYGVNHPRILAIKDEILVKETYLQQLPMIQRQRMMEMARTELGPRLSQYLNQQLQKNEANERAISARLTRVSAGPSRAPVLICRDSSNR